MIEFPVSSSDIPHNICPSACIGDPCAVPLPPVAYLVYSPSLWFSSETVEVSAMEPLANVLVVIRRHMIDLVFIVDQSLHIEVHCEEE